MLFVSKNISLEKVAFMNSLCCVMCKLNWIVFMAIVQHSRVKMRLASLVFIITVRCKLDFHSKLPAEPTFCVE